MLKKLSAKKPVPISFSQEEQKSSHIFEESDVLAAKAAFAAGRPLLIRGEPGTGKTQFAKAVATQCDCLFISVVVNGTTELEELFWRYDAVARLADAQIMDSSLDSMQRADLLDQRRYLIPGPLWWAFNWISADEHIKTRCQHRYHRPDWVGTAPPKGVVLLIDEIDKADPDLPNGLLEAFGQHGFTNPWVEKGRVFQAGCPLLTVVTTNEERELPKAFLRRCLVRELRYPPESDTELFNEWMIERARAHFTKGQCADAVLQKAAELIHRDRSIVKEEAAIRPGLAELIDLVRAVSELHPENTDEQLAAVLQLSEFVLSKQPTSV